MLTVQLLKNALEIASHQQMLTVQVLKNAHCSVILDDIGMQKSKTTSGVWRGGGGYETIYSYVVSDSLKAVSIGHRGSPKLHKYSYTSSKTSRQCM